MVIGIFDSGLGGLSVWRHLRQNLTARLLYFGDTAHVPYGEKSPAQLQGYFWDILEFFQNKGCQGVVVACNTSSALVLPQVKTKVEIPIFGIIEGAVQATLATSQGRVGVLATRATTESGVYQEAFRRERSDWQVFVQSAPRLVPLVEQGQIKEDAAKQAVKEYLAPLLVQNIDTLLLGCTHYPFLHALISEVVGPNVQIVDPAPALGLQVRQALPHLAEIGAGNPETEFWVSAHPEKFRSTAQLLLQEEMPPVGLHQLSGERA